MTVQTIAVRSHVARDLLQSAALFRTDKLVVWEYVSNGLQYRELGVPPVVNVTLDSAKKRVVIDDNGAGMDRKGLQNFFVMHGENQERKAGRPGRGKFGTGKSAAFGIADRLMVSSIRNGKRNTVELTRKSIEAAGEDEIPVKIVERDVSTHEPNGTIITIDKLHLKKFDKPGVVSFIERKLARRRDKPLVTVNNEPCEYTEPPVAQTRVCKPNEQQRHILGDVELTLMVAKTHLDSDLHGVAIHANGELLETSLAGAEGQPMSQYIFGHIDVPALDDDSAPIPAFDMSRSMQLNRSNEVVQVLMAFVGFEVDQIRRELVKNDKARRAQEEIKRLNSEARLIAEMINCDFREFSDRIARVKAKSGTGHDIGKSPRDSGEDTDELVSGEHVNASQEQNVPGDSPPAPSPDDPPQRSPDSTPPKPPEPDNSLKSDENGQAKGDPIGGNGNSKRLRGGFEVDFREMGEQAFRAEYQRDNRTIYINLEHPQIRAARGKGTLDDPIFRRLVYEVAFAEYANALAREMDENGEFLDPDDARVAIRQTLDRMARRAAALYAT